MQKPSFVSGGCYVGTEQVFYLDDADTGIKQGVHEAAVDRFGEDMALETTSQKGIKLETNPRSCLSDPDECGLDGLTLTLWLKFESYPQQDGYIFR